MSWHSLSLLAPFVQSPAALVAAAASAAGPLDFLFQPWHLRLGSVDLAERDIWSNGMDFFRIGLALTMAGLLLIEARAARLGEKLSARASRRLAILATVLGFLAYFDGFNPNVRYDRYYHRHELFHYYLGSKYSDELGYTRLYECAAVAEAELGHTAELKKEEIRDLRVNLIKPMTATYVFDDPKQCTSRFSPHAWAAFKKDVAWFRQSALGTYWTNMKKDHGYNPPPVWTMTGKFFSNFGEAGDGFFKLLALIDVVLHVGILALLGWAFGVRIMAIASVFWGCNAVANFYWTGGAFMRQDWIFFFVAAACLAKKRKFALAGGALTWSALLRVFPLIAFAGWVVIIAIDLIRKRRLHPDHARLLGGCVVAAGLLIPASLVVTGPGAYEEFVHHIGVHKNTPLTNHMGLETMLAHGAEGRMRFTRDETLDDPFAPWKDARRQRFQHLRPVFFATVLGVTAWLVWALRRTKLLWVGLVLSLPLVIALTNLTCYYYCMFLIAAGLTAIRPGFAPVYLVASGASQILLRCFWFIDDRYTAESWLFFVLSLVPLALYSRPFSVARLRAWLRGEPEPKPAPKPAPQAAALAGVSS